MRTAARIEFSSSHFKNTPYFGKLSTSQRICYNINMKTLLHKFLRFVPFALMLVPFAADAHVGLGSASGFWHGFLHPLSGLDHILIMVGAGIWARQSGGHAYWVLQLVFVPAMMADEHTLGMIYGSGFIFSALLLYVCGIMLGSFSASLDDI